jgi:K+-transporting ATPase ATPase C chain
MRPGRDLTTAAIAIVLFTGVLGIGYPLAITAVSQVAFGARADGSRDLIGTPRLTAAKRPDPAFFQPRPSATGYSASATFFSNRGPNAASARAFYRHALAAYHAREDRYSPGLTDADVPVDAVTTSASGVDPHISPANAAIQARRVAAVRGIAPARVLALVAAHTDGRFLGVFGEPGVNVQALNRALGR